MGTFELERFQDRGVEVVSWGVCASAPRGGFWFGDGVKIVMADGKEGFDQES
jgi:hypothetical protein